MLLPGPGRGPPGRLPKLVRGPGGGGGTFAPPGGGGIDLPLPDVGREGAVGGGVEVVRAAGRSSAGVGRDAGAAGGAIVAAAGRSIGAGAGGAGGAGEERTTRCAERTTAGLGSSTATGADAAGARGSPAAGATGATAATAAALGSGGAGAGWGSTTGARLRPRESASRRTRSAEGSSILDEWLFTPILSSLESSTTTALSTPSSRASS